MKIAALLIALDKYVFSIGTKFTFELEQFCCASLSSAGKWRSR